MPNVNDRKVILITAVGGDIGNSYAKSVANEEFSLIGCDINSSKCEKSLFEQLFQVPSASQPQKYLDAIKNICHEYAVDLVVPICEPEIKTFHENRKECSSWKTQVLINNDLILDNFLDKYKTMKYLESIDIKVPKTYLLKDYRDQLGYPMIVKRRNSCGSKNIWKVEANVDLEYLKRKDDGMYLIQEYLQKDDQEFTTGVFSDGKNISSITFKRRLGLGGLSVEVDLADSPEMDGMVEKIARETKLIGSINIQSRLCEGTYIPFEINPRFSSTLSFRKQFGFADCLWWPRVGLGGAYEYKRQYKSGHGERYLAESYAEMNRI